METAFGALTQQLEAGVSIDRLIDTCLLLAADRMARVPVNVEAGWPCLTREFNLAAALRTVQRYGGPAAAARGLVHAAWQFFDDRWLNIPYRPLSEPLTTSASTEDPASIVEAIQTLNVQEVGPRVLAYGLAGHPGEPLIEAMGRAILWDDTAHQLLPTLGNRFRGVGAFCHKRPPSPATDLGGASPLCHRCAHQQRQWLGRARGSALCPRPHSRRYLRGLRRKPCPEQASTFVPVARADEVEEGTAQGSANRGPQRSALSPPRHLVRHRQPMSAHGVSPHSGPGAQWRTHLRLARLELRHAGWRLLHRRLRRSGHLASGRARRSGIHRLWPEPAPSAGTPTSCS